MSLTKVTFFATVLITSPSYSFDLPSYQNETLTIPRVDTPSQIGQYQNVVFGANADGTWQVKSGQILNTQSIWPITTNLIEAVEVIKGSGFPASVYLRVSGRLNAGCAYVGPARIHQRLEGARFDVSISIPENVANSSCTSGLSPFKFTVPLEIYGLSAGTYTYNVNGVPGGFGLDHDNKFADDRGVDVIDGAKR